jgi:sulfoxide reductase heme-binding subunit YedZ
VYAVAVLAVLHFFWMRAGKNNFVEVWVYASVLFVLLAWRVRRSRLFVSAPTTPAPSVPPLSRGDE